MGWRHGLIVVILIVLSACAGPSAPTIVAPESSAVNNTPAPPAPTATPAATLAPRSTLTLASAATLATAPPPATAATPAPAVTPTPAVTPPSAVVRASSPTAPPPAPTLVPALPAKPAPAPTATVAPASASGVAGLPKRLRVPRLRIDALVEQVGLDPEGAMDVPKGYDTVGWYNLGTRPGELGSAVMAGHLDSKTGPAIFWRLRDLKVGDDIFVISDDGKERRFRVSETVVYRFDQAPLERIFAAPEGIGLNLITCGGSFDRQTQNYEQRVVVYTTLAS